MQINTGWKHCQILLSNCRDRMGTNPSRSAGGLGDSLGGNARIVIISQVKYNGG